MIFDFFHIAKEQITLVLNKAKESGEISNYEIDINFDDYKLDITIYPKDNGPPFKIDYKFERIKNNESNENGSLE